MARISSQPLKGSNPQFKGGFSNDLGFNTIWYFATESYIYTKNKQRQSLIYILKFKITT